VILVFGVGLAVVVGLLRGGNLRNFGNIRVRWAWLALAALTIQVVLIDLLPNWSGAARLFFPLTHLAILAVIWANRDLDGMRLLAAGVALNLIVIAANGGFMPVAPEVLVRAGIADSVESVPLYTRVARSKGLVLPRDEIVLGWLSDTIPLRPIQTIVSIGDVLMVPGVFLFVEKAMLRQEDW
jgi:hypothetical protein